MKRNKFYHGTYLRGGDDSDVLDSMITNRSCHCLSNTSGVKRNHGRETAIAGSHFPTNENAKGRHPELGI